MEFFNFLPFALAPFIAGFLIFMFCYYYMMIVASTKYKDTPYSFTGINDDTYSLFREYTQIITDKKLKRKYKRVLLWVWLAPIVGAGTFIMSLIGYVGVSLFPLF